MIKKYEIQRHVKIDPNSDFHLVGFYDTKIVSKKEFEKLKNEGWFLVRVKYLFLTDLEDWWNSFNRDQKINITGISIMALIGILTLILTLPSNTNKLKENNLQEPKKEDHSSPVTLSVDTTTIKDQE